MKQIKFMSALCCVICILAVCHNTDCDIISKTDKEQGKSIFLSQNEYQSIANDNPTELTSNEINHLINDFALTKSKSRSISSTDFKIISKYYLSNSSKSRNINMKISLKCQTWVNL